MSVIEALYIFDEHNTPLLEHTYTGRPPPGSTVLPLYLSEPPPRSSLIYLPSTNPPTLLYSIIQDSLLFLAPCSKDTEPLQVLEFLHRVAEVLEDFLGSPLLASKIEAHYDVVAQLLSEMVDGGIISSTEPNALKEVVEAPNLIKNLLGGMGLPSSTPSSLTPSATPFSLSSRPSLARPNPTANTGSTVPWRRANVRHTSNELYVDIVETLHVTIAPSGRPLSAIANGTIAMTAKVSGVPDLLLQLGSLSGVSNTISLPVFHPCVRLNRWKERPGELSFVPPDGRFVLAGYEVDLLGPAALDGFSTSTKASGGPKLNIPALVSIITSLGPTGTDFEVRLTLNPRFAGKKASSPLPSATGSSFSRGGGLGRGIGGAGFGSSATQGTTAAPSIEEVVVHIPLPATVKNVTDLRVSKGAGEASYAPGDRGIEWRLSSREVSLIMSSDRGVGTGAIATLRGSLTSNPYDYEEDTDSSYRAPSEAPIQLRKDEGSDAKRIKQNKILMPSAATVSFSVKGWLPSGVKVDSLNVDAKRSQGLGAGVTPYKGVKYLCVSRKGVEARC
ncbi:Adaptor complexes medium subunit family-domain-containing protein [Dendryphion nanum]|uniref:Adaptor complexes medium subunit family-domain-containing protein n=1 Tax=Dendryphion nanum TaxID=256645 RepID=A0A9P9ECY9_9PLEO|nr:Adaptor complexes medium subunit family-domain-containing protein [Dendryphion nanum]